MRHSTFAACSLCRGATLALLACAAASARWSDPVRNLHPEEPSAPAEVQSPIYYLLPMGAVTSSATPAPEELLQAFMNNHTAMNYVAAAEAAMRLINAVPDRPVGYYNLACAMARMQRTDEAFDALKHAVEFGWRDMVHMRIDPDLAGLRNDKRFDAVIDAIKAHIDAERIPPTPPRTDSWEVVARDLTHDVPALLERFHVPGASVALIRDGRIVWSEAFGKRDVRGENPLDDDDLFRLRAPLHILTIAACQQLEEQRKMQLAALVVRAANEHAVARLETRKASPAQPAALPANIRTNDKPGVREDERPTQEVAGARGRIRNYTRTSVYGFLRLAVEEASAEPFTNYCERSILQPLQLRASGFAEPEEGDHVAVGHSDLGTPLRPSVVQGEFAPGGSVYMTARDLARLVASSMDASTQHAAGVEQDAAAREAIFADDEQEQGGCKHHKSGTRTLPGLGYAIDMVTQADATMSGSLGLALQRIESDDGMCYELRESASGIVCLARWRPGLRDGVVVLCNSATGREAAERIAHLALGGE